MIDTNIGFNTHLNNLKNNLINTINKSGLPVGIVYYIVKDLFIDISNAYDQALKNEKETAEASKKEVEIETKEEKSKTKK